MPTAMPHNSDLARVWRKAAEQGCEVRQLAERVFTVRQRLLGWPSLTTRIMRWQMGELHAFGTLEEIEAWLDKMWTLSEPPIRTHCFDRSTSCLPSCSPP